MAQLNGFERKKESGTSFGKEMNISLNWALCMAGKNSLKFLPWTSRVAHAVFTAVNMFEETRKRKENG